VERRFRFSTSQYRHWSELIIIVTKRHFVEGREKSMNEILTLISNFGFPIVMSAYLLVRIEGKLSELTISITELAKVVAIIKV